SVEPYSLFGRRALPPAERVSATGVYGIFGARGSPGLCAGELDYFAPLLGIVSDDLAEIRDRAGKYHAPKVGKPRLQLGISEPRIDLAIELINDLGRRVFGRTEANPLARLETRHEIAHSGDIRQCLWAHRCGHCQGAQPTSPNVFDRRRHVGKRHLDLPAKQIGDRWSRATIRHVCQINASYHLEKFSDHMSRAPIAARAHADLAGI